MRGKFIVFEGIDGAGTTTQIERTATFLKEKGYRVHTTAEPSRGPIGAMIRQILDGRIVSDDGTLPDPKTIALLYAADRIDHLENEVTPYLDKGYIVLSDRYYISSLVYQGDFTEDLAWVTEINRYAYPADLTLLFTISGIDAFKRLNENRSFLDCYEKEAYLIAFAQKYDSICASLKKKENILIVDAMVNIDDVSRQIQNHIATLLSFEK